MTPLRFPNKIYIHCRPDSENHTGERNVIYQRRIEILPRDLVGVIFNEGGRQIRLSELFLDRPMPVGKETITPAMPDSQDEPTGQSQTQRDEVQSARAPPDPADEVK